MILVDTSVWVDHLRAGNARLADALRALPVVPVADDDEALFFIERNALMGRGIGYIDAHLLAATAIATPTRLWTHDKRLGAIAAELALAHRAAAT